jgi:tetratricopeptide (TPR) repeat protein
MAYKVQDKSMCLFLQNSLQVSNMELVEKIDVSSLAIAIRREIIPKIQVDLDLSSTSIPNPSTICDWVQLIEEFKIKGEGDKAQVAYQKGLDIIPKGYIGWNSRACLHIRFDKFDEANECLEKSLYLNPKYYLAIYNKACIEALNENETQAINYLQKAIEGDQYLKLLAQAEKDFDCIRSLSSFQDLVYT